MRPAVVLILVAPVLVLAPSASAAPAAPAAGSCTVMGTPGDDVLRGTARADVICGRGGDDVLRGRAGNDVLRGGPGNDAMVPGPGRNQVRGGNGVDAVSYTRLPEPVVADLGWRFDFGFVTGAVEDKLFSVEDLAGTSGPDRLIGDNRANDIAGRGGDDVILGTVGADRIDGGGGTDTADYYSRYEDPFYAGVWIDLATGIVHDSLRDGTIAGVENLVGTAYEDSLYGDAGDNVLDGGRGDDWLDGRDGVDTVLGGWGDDLLFARTGGTADHPEQLNGGWEWDQVTFAEAPLPVWATDNTDGDAGPDDGTAYLVLETEEILGTPWADHIHVGAGAAEVWITGGGGADDIDVTDGFGGDEISGADTSTCVGDPGDIVAC